MKPRLIIGLDWTKHLLLTEKDKNLVGTVGAIILYHTSEELIELSITKIFDDSNTADTCMYCLDEIDPIKRNAILCMPETITRNAQIILKRQMPEDPYQGGTGLPINQYTSYKLRCFFSALARAVQADPDVIRKKADEIKFAPYDLKSVAELCEFCQTLSDRVTLTPTLKDIQKLSPSNTTTH